MTNKLSMYILGAGVVLAAGVVTSIGSEMLKTAGEDAKYPQTEVPGAINGAKVIGGMATTK